MGRAGQSDNETDSSAYRFNTVDYKNIVGAGPPIPIHGSEGGFAGEAHINP